MDNLVIFICGERVNMLKIPLVSYSRFLNILYISDFGLE